MPTIPYRLSDGSSVPGVTTILKNCGWGTDALIYWAWKRGRDFPEEKLYEKQQEYFDVGTLAHLLAEYAIQRKKIPKKVFAGYSAEVVEQAKRAHSNFEHWLQGNKIEIIALEKHMVSEQYRYGGTPDLIAIVNGEPAIVDYKSSKAVYDTYWLQLGAYRNLVSEALGITVNAVHILRISKDYHGWDHQYREIAPWMWDGFHACLLLHEIKTKL